MRLRILRRAPERRLSGGGVELVEDVGEVVARKLPAEGAGDGFVSALKRKESLWDFAQIGEVVGRENLPLHDRKVDLDLVEPAGVDGQMHQDEFGVVPVSVSQPLDGTLPAVGGPVVDD